MNTRGRFFPLLILAILALVFFIFLSLHQSISELNQTVITKRGLLQFIDTYGSTLQLSERPISDVSSLEASLKAKNLDTFIQKIEKRPNQKNETVQIAFSKIPFDALIKWLIELHQTSRLNVTAFSAEKTSPDGTVNVVLTLSAVSSV